LTGATRTVFITGCSSGIGRATAGLCARAGHRVIATARRPETLGDLVALAEREHLQLKAAACDVTNEDSMKRAVDFAHASFGEINVLVNNAGYGAMGPLEAVPMIEARRQLEVNTFGPMRLIQLIAPDMRRARWGRIVNVSSVLGRVVQPLSGWYCASKFALEAISDTLRLELEPFGIHTVSILPGPVRTAFTSNMTVCPLPADMPDFYRRLVAYRMGLQHDRPFEVPAEAAAKLILRAVRARRPRARYLLTVPTHIAIRLRPLLTVRAWDKLVARYFGVNRVSMKDERTTR
jgi:NAD(P)-dependent dehydrogenase (short-subunit alcohol dehydrogenase family)